MASTHHFAQGVRKRKACDNFLDSISGTIGFFEEKQNTIWGQWKTKNKLIHSFLPWDLQRIHVKIEICLIDNQDIFFLLFE